MAEPTTSAGEERGRGRPRILKDKCLEQVTAGVDPEVYAAIKATAKRRGVPIADVIRSVLRRAFPLK